MKSRLPGLWDCGRTGATQGPARFSRRPCHTLDAANIPRNLTAAIAPFQRLDEISRAARCWRMAKGKISGRVGDHHTFSDRPDPVTSAGETYLQRADCWRTSDVASVSAPAACCAHGQGRAGPAPPKTPGPARPFQSWYPNVRTSRRRDVSKARATRCLSISASASVGRSSWRVVDGPTERLKVRLGELILAVPRCLAGLKRFSVSRCLPRPYSLRQVH